MPLLVKTSQFKIVPASKSERWLIFDLESNGLYDAVTVIYCIVIHDIGSQQTFTYGPDCIADALAHLATADVLIGHNIIFFDIPVLQKLHSFVAKARIIDTLICTRLIWPKEVLDVLDTEQYPQVPPANRGSASLKAAPFSTLTPRLSSCPTGSTAPKTSQLPPVTYVLISK